MCLGMLGNIWLRLVKSRREVMITGPTIRAIRLVTVFSYLRQLGKRVYVQSLKVCGLDLGSYLSV